MKQQRTSKLPPIQKITGAYGVPRTKVSLEELGTLTNRSWLAASLDFFEVYRFDDHLKHRAGSFSTLGICSKKYVGIQLDNVE